MDENNGTYLTQRKDHKLALVVPHFEDDKYLCLNAPNMKTLKVDMGADNEEPKKIRSFFFLHYTVFSYIKKFACTTVKYCSSDINQ